MLYFPNDDKQKSVDELPEEAAETLDSHAGFVLFDGRRAHAVANFTGERYSLVLIGFQWISGMKKNEMYYGVSSGATPWSSSPSVSTTTCRKISAELCGIITPMTRRSKVSHRCWHRHADTMVEFNRACSKPCSDYPSNNKPFFGL